MSQRHINTKHVTSLHLARDLPRFESRCRFALKNDRFASRWDHRLRFTCDLPSREFVRFWRLTFRDNGFHVVVRISRCHSVDHERKQLMADKSRARFTLSNNSTRTFNDCTLFFALDAHTCTLVGTVASFMLIYSRARARTRIYSRRRPAKLGRFLKCDSVVVVGPAGTMPET